MIGYYVHHHGRGHLTRARGVAAHLDEPVIGLSSLPPPPEGHSPCDGWVQLARDDAAGGPADPTAHGTLHWVPRHDAGLRDRMSAIAAWIETARPSVVVVDVSVEVAALVRLLGVPVVVVALPGDRADRAHQLAFGMADAILAFWPQEVYDPPWLQPHAARTHFVGAASRFDGRPLAPAVTPRARRSGVLIGGTGGSEITAEQYAELPDSWDWQVLTGNPPQTWIDDPWPALCAADVVVTHAGQNAVAEVAAAGRPAVVLPQARPYREQERTAQALAGAGIAHVPAAWPTAAEWPSALARAQVLGGTGWPRWRGADAARSAAAVIAAVGRSRH